MNFVAYYALFVAVGRAEEKFTKSGFGSDLDRKVKEIEHAIIIRELEIEAYVAALLIHDAEEESKFVFWGRKVTAPVCAYVRP